jgi:hypothetical protein
MVDNTEIDRTFRTYFRVSGKYEIDHVGRINAHGDVDAREDFPGPHLPVQFGVVHGDFNLEVQDHLIDLQGAPHSVTGEMVVRADNLEYLTGAPAHVGGRCVIRSQQLKSLAHLPKTVNMLRLNMSTHLPLLRLTETSYPIQWGFPTSLGGISNLQLKTATDIINKYRGTGKAGVIRAAAELVRAGCKENARW